MIGDCIAAAHGHRKVTPRFVNSSAFGRGLKVIRYFWIFELGLRCVCALPSIWGSKRVILNDFGAAVIFNLLKPLIGNVPSVYIFHGLLEESSSKFIKIKKKVLISFLKQSSVRTIYVSDSIRKIAISEGYPDGLVGHMGFYLPRIVSTSNSRIKHSPEDPLVFFLGGRINERKMPLGSLDFLNEVARLSNRYVEVRIAGSDSGHLKALLACALKFEANMRVVHLGFMRNFEVMTVMQHCDFVFNPSTYKEAAPTIAYEAGLLRVGYVYLFGESHVELGAYNPSMCIGIESFSVCEAARFVALLANQNRSVKCIARNLEPIGILG